jgi:hypothetical protein
MQAKPRQQAILGVQCFVFSGSKGKFGLTRKVLMRRRDFLKLGVVAGGTVLLGGTGRFGALVAAPIEIPRAV